MKKYRRFDKLSLLGFYSLWPDICCDKSFKLGDHGHNIMTKVGSNETKVGSNMTKVDSNETKVIHKIVNIESKSTKRNRMEIMIFR